MVSNITKRSKSGGIDKVSKWRSPERNVGVRVSELTGLDMVVTNSRNTTVERIPVEFRTEFRGITIGFKQR